MIIAIYSPDGKLGREFVATNDTIDCALTDLYDQVNANNGIYGIEDVPFDEVKFFDGHEIKVNKIVTYYQIQD